MVNRNSKMTRKKIIAITAGILVLVAAAVFCFHARTDSFESLPEAEHIDVTDASGDFSEQSQIYFEYIGTYLKNRSGRTGDHDNAQQWIVSELEKAGYDSSQITLQDIPDCYGKNIILRVEGKDPSKMIIAGAHYDGDGAGDNGSGTALLLATARGLQKQKLPVTTVFVFFDEEESGLFGSEAFADSLTKEEAESTIYMINIDAIGFGDYCNLYSGIEDEDTGEVTQLEAYDYACGMAREQGLNVYGPEDLDGYYAKHGKGPKLDPKGLFTNPWTRANPAPENTVDESLHYYSPMTIPASDHVPFMEKGIPYLYFEATNWYMKSNNDDIAYIGYTDVGDESVGDGGIIMNTEYDTLETMAEYYPGRSLEHFRLYSPLLTELILKPMK